ncbi:MAG: mechanosensitive ion channel family protein [Sedimenticola sp.]|nr:mechanosensitive ion channel family protein [Sedimenticola sp.]
MMSDWMSWLEQLGGVDRLMTLMRASFILLVGFLVARVIRSLVGRLLQKHASNHHLTLWRRGAYYLVLGLFVISALRELGFNLGVLVGAAGIVSVAVGFASQTSASNLISGLFLLAEKPFQIGDVIKVGDTTGEVLTIDLLSVKLRTYDNLYVRIPNESLIKSQVTTLTRFPIRRIDLPIGIAYKEDISRVRDILNEVADKNRLCLEEPKPVFIFKGYGESSLDIQFSVWVKRENLLELRNSIYEEIKVAFDAASVEIPFPHRTLYTGSVTEPFPFKVVNDRDKPDQSDHS